MQIDDRIQQAQRRGAGLYMLSAVVTLIVVGGVLSWLFLVRAYVVAVGPDEASQTAVLKGVSGTVFVKNDTIYTLGGEVSVNVSADTFESSLLTIDANSPTNLEVVLAPTPARLQVKATASENAELLDETSWYIDGKLIGIGASLDYTIAAGSYQLQLQNPYFLKGDKTLKLARAQIVDIELALESFSGKASINTQPQGAEIFIDGASQGETPITLDLRGGLYDLVAKRDGYQTLEDRLSLKVQQPEISREYQLQAVQAALNVSTTPEGGVLLINNLEKATGTHSLDANIAHSVSYQKPGFFPFSQRITLTQGQQRDINIVLEPELGNVQIRTNMQAQLTINGVNEGAIDQQGKQFILPAKAVSISVSKPGYRTVQQSIVPSSDRDLSLNIELLSEFDARRKEGRPLFATQLGINLLRFSPGAYTMGSPPNETGRRRNEHQIEVDFSRDIFVSETEVTQAQFSAFSSAQSSSSKQPQVNVSWNQAALFCNWLSEQEGLPKFYRSNGDTIVGYDPGAIGYRLPTEAEWEWLAKKAKRARSTVYVWGDQTRIPTNAGNFADQSAKSNQLIHLQDYDDKFAGVADVASFKADRIGLYDLAGNVSEWVNDSYTTALPNTDIVHTDYLGASRGSQHVVKGGNYKSGRLRELRAAFREVGESPKDTIGFRIARYAE
ncbi:SUMF1/EgtB/PvdO family nonheme iron enzyme [Ningiella sp. W23]|uniref:SUMF1/EgtB/PvdO family nonheme iron enzyme n=1 Tax=Ningiella sp. W23 TaxID=3023715 RepID=UPI003757E5C8